MDKIERTSSDLIVESDCFDARATLFCGQVFRFKPKNEGFELVSGDKMCFITTRNCAAENGIYKVDSCKGGSEKDRGINLNDANKVEEKTSHDNSDNENLVIREKCHNVVRTEIITQHPDYFARYFDLNTDYGQIIKTLAQYDELAPALLNGRGIHILKQQLFETIISFIISANNNIPRIQGIIERLCTEFGQEMDGYYAFPTAERLRDARAEDYKRLGAGYRADYLQSTVHKILNSDILQRLPTLDYENAQKLLKTLKGVGQKVADCVCLFGLSLTDCYPTDTWIKKAEGLGSAAQARQRGMDRYGDLAGYAQQYRFYYQMSKGR